MPDEQVLENVLIWHFFYEKIISNIEVGEKYVIVLDKLFKQGNFLATVM